MHPERESVITPREAGARFVRGAAYGWGRRELATWLVCQYAPCTTPAGDVRLRSACGNGAKGVLRDNDITSIVEKARRDALAVLTELRDPMRAAAIARVMVAAGFIDAVRDVRGARAFVPVAQERMKLSERVASLFVADCMNAPFDYRWVYVCGQCSEVSFGTSVICCAPRRESVIRFAAAVRSIARERASSHPNAG
jgi:hypothetical protein